MLEAMPLLAGWSGLMWAERADWSQAWSVLASTKFGAAPQNAGITLVSAGLHQIWKNGGIGLEAQWSEMSGSDMIPPDLSF